MANYYIDYENVHNEGLKGVQRLQKGDRLYLFYSAKADTLKIDVVRQLMECQAEISFDKIVNGVENALDFQLITALMCNYKVEDDYYIISRDKGYDAAIEMAGKQNRTNIYRCRDIEGAIKHQEGLSIDESDQEIIVDLEAFPSDDTSIDTTPLQMDADVVDKAANVVDNSSSVHINIEDNIADSYQEIKQDSPLYESDNAVDNEIIKIDKTETDIQQEPYDQEVKDAADDELEENENSTEAVVLTEDEIKRRAHQSICTKILNHVKLIQKIPLVYKQAEEICEALEDSDSKMQFYHRLLQSMGRKKGGELYQKVKAVYKPIRGIYQASITGEEQSEDGKSAVIVEDAELKAGNAVLEVEEQVQSIEPEVQEKPQCKARRGRPPRSAKTPRVSRKRSKLEADGESLPTQQVEAVRAAFEQAEQQQGSAGEAILQMVELAKNI